jgi:CubicO group peptidase (beta-lactamase class C family)
MIRSATLLFITFLLTAHSAAPQTIDTGAVDRIMNGAMAEWHVPGAALAIVQNDKVVYLKGYGVRETVTRAPVTADTLFNIASMTKAFTATAMAMLVDEGKLDWDDPVRQHLPYFRLSDPCADSMVTLRDLLSHRTGLAGYDALWDNSLLGREEVIRRMASAKAVRPFRSGYRYDNIMFIAAGEAVAATAGVSWDSFVQKRILEPLGMADTRLTLDGYTAGEHAIGYRWDGVTSAMTPYGLVDDSNLGSAGEIKSSARDMAKWVRFHLGSGTIDGKRLVSAEALGETKQPNTVVRPGPPDQSGSPVTHLDSYAMGWGVQDYRGELLVSHGGALNGFRGTVALLPERNTGFVILDNLGRGAAVTAMRNSLLDLLLATKDVRDWNNVLLASEHKSELKADAAKRALLATRVPNTRPTHELGAYAGTYQDAVYGAATVALDRDHLVLHWQRMMIPLEYFHYDTFRAVSPADDLDDQVTFRTASDGTISGMIFMDAEFTRRAEKSPK